MDKLRKDYEKYPDGKYIGEVKKIKEGYGTMFYDNGDIYEGLWKNDKKNGILKFKKGEKYKGEFVNNIFEDYGILNLTNGLKYEGNFKQGFFHGYGVLTNQNVTFKGNFFWGEKKGKFIIINNNIQREVYY